MPTVKVSDQVYQKIVRFVGSLQTERGKLVSMDDALQEVFARLDRWENIKVK